MRTFNNCIVSYERVFENSSSYFYLEELAIFTKNNHIINLICNNENQGFTSFTELYAHIIKILNTNNFKPTILSRDFGSIWFNIYFTENNHIKNLSYRNKELNFKYYEK